jgi:hypothetical protein
MNLPRPPQPVPPRTPTSKLTKVIPPWVAAIACLGILLLAAGAVIALIQPSLLLAPDDQITHGVRVYADYLFSRNLAVAVTLAAALVARARRLVAALMALTALMQIFDIALDAATARWVLIPGLVVFGAAFALGATRLNRPVTRSVSPPDAQVDHVAADGGMSGKLLTPQLGHPDQSS